MNSRQSTETNYLRTVIAMILRKSFSKKFVSNSAFMFVMMAMTFFSCLTSVRAGIYPVSMTLDILPEHSATVGSVITAGGITDMTGAEIRLYLSDTVFLASTISDEDGTYSIDIAVPAIPCGTYKVTAVNIVSGASAMTDVAIEPCLLLTPDSGSAGDVISISGSGFASNSYVEITLNGTYVSLSETPYTDFLGSFKVDFQLPSTPAETQVCLAEDVGGNNASACLEVTPQIRVYPTSGSSSALIQFVCSGFASSNSLCVYFDSVEVTPHSYSTTGPDGSFYGSFFAPPAPDGVHMIHATDDSTNSAEAPFTMPGPILNVTPKRALASSIVTVTGEGFQPRTPVVLYVEETIATSLIDLMWTSDNIMPATNGSLHYSFLIPIEAPGVYTVSARQAFDPSPQSLAEVASAELAIYETVGLDSQVSVGSVHFRGETAEFYLTTALYGKQVDAQIDDAKLYCLNGTYCKDLIGTATRIALGLFRFSYDIPADATFGTYAVVIEANYETELSTAHSTVLSSFLLSQTLTGQNAHVLSIDSNIATIVIPNLGTINENLSRINSKLIGIEGKIATMQTDIGIITANVDTIKAIVTNLQNGVATIDSDVGTLTTSADSINAKITSIENGVATVSSDLGTVKLQTTESSPQLNTTMLLSLVAAIGATAAAASTTIMYRRKSSEPSTSTTKDDGNTPAPPPEPQHTDTPVKQSQNEAEQSTQPITQEQSSPSENIVDSQQAQEPADSQENAQTTEKAHQPEPQPVSQPEQIIATEPEPIPMLPMPSEQEEPGQQPG